MKMANKKYNQIKTKTKIQEKTKTNKQTIKDTKTTDYNWNDNPRSNIVINTCIY